MRVSTIVFTLDGTVLVSTAGLGGSTFTYVMVSRPWRAEDLVLPSTNFMLLNKDEFVVGPSSFAYYDLRTDSFTRTSCSKTINEWGANDDPTFTPTLEIFFYSSQTVAAATKSLWFCAASTTTILQGTGNVWQTSAGSTFTVATTAYQIAIATITVPVTPVPGSPLRLLIWRDPVSGAPADNAPALDVTGIRLYEKALLQ
jgi:hypothetical protein